MARRCVFCGSRGLSNEHVVPEWVLDYLPGEGEFDHRIMSEEGPERRWRAPAPDIKVKVVCQPCNSGWMSNIENRAKPFLGSLIQGHGRTLHREGQRELAVWGIKTAMMWQFTSKTRPIPPAIMKALYADDSKPPGNAQVWIGAYTGEAGYSYPVSLSVRPKGAGLDAAVDAYGATFTVGHVAFQVFGHELPGVGGGRRFADGSLLARGFSPIWPFVEPATFPTSHVWTLKQLEEAGRYSWGPDLPDESK